MKQELKINSSNNELLDLFIWEPDSEPCGIIQIVHGMAEHIERYNDFAISLNKMGYIVAGHNHLGHGKNAIIKGYIADENGFDILVEDVRNVTNFLKNKYPNLPFFLLGHSMGSFITRAYCLRYSDINGVIISGTGYFSPVLLNLGSAIASVECALGRNKKNSKLLHSLSFSKNNKRFMPCRTPFDWLSRDNSQVDAYLDDSLCGFSFTSGGYKDLFTLLKQLQPQYLHNLNSKVPAYFISGEVDPVGNNGKGVIKVANEWKNAGVKNIEIKLYPNGRHEMLNEINKEEVWCDIITWLEKITP